MAETLVDVALVVTLWATGIELGLSLGFRGMFDPARRVGLAARATALDVIGIPLFVWALVTMMSIPTGPAIGLLLVGACSAGPLGIKLSQIARGDVGFAVSLVIVLEIANAAAVPAWMALMVPVGVVIPYAQMIATLTAVLLVPLGLGAVIGTRSAAAKRHLPGPLRSTANVGLAVVIALLIGRDFDSVVDTVASGVVAVAVITVSTALVTGWVCGGPDRATRVTTGLVTGVRANALALAIARSSFPEDSSTTVAVVAFGLVSITMPAIVALHLGRRRRAEPADRNGG